MEIIAQDKTGFLISATKSEINSILSAVNGKCPEKIELGQRLPAIDYSNTIHKIKSLATNYDYKQLISKVDSFNNEIQQLKEIINNATNIEI